MEHQRKIARIGVDDLQHLGGRGLPLERFLLLGQEPRVFDRDRPLIGKGGDKFDLLGRERLHPLTREHDDAGDFAVAKHRNPERGALPRQFDRCLVVPRNRRDVRYMNNARLANCSPTDRRRTSVDVTTHPPCWVSQGR